MKLPGQLANPGRIKNLIHGVQAVAIFFAWALTIAVFTNGAGIDGREAWYWALVSSDRQLIGTASNVYHSVGLAFLL